MARVGVEIRREVWSQSPLFWDIRFSEGRKHIISLIYSQHPEECLA
jgi:hypothetical protein